MSNTPLTPDSKLEFFELAPGESLQVVRTINSDNIDLGQFIIRLPDGNDKCFMIYHDLAGLFGLNEQRLAANKIKKQELIIFLALYYVNCVFC